MYAWYHWCDPVWPLVLVVCIITAITACPCRERDAADIMVLGSGCILVVVHAGVRLMIFSMCIV